MRDRKEKWKSSTSRRLFITRPTERISCNRNSLDRIFFCSAGAVQSQAITPPVIAPVFRALNLLLGTGTAAGGGGACPLGLRALVS